MKRTLPQIVFCVVFFLLLLIVAKPALIEAQKVSYGVSTNIPIENKQVRNGDIVSFSQTGYVLSSLEYDPLVMGVVTDRAAIAINASISGQTYQVLSIGTAYV